MKVSFIIPTLNEHGNITRLIDRINEITIENKIINEIIVIDDNSTDGTIEDVKRLQEQQGNIHLVVRERPMGVGSAHIVGYNLATGDVIISMDADLSHPPEKILELIEKIQSNYDMVMGSRYIRGGATDKTFKFYFLSKLGGIFLSHLLKIKILDFTTGYRAIKKELCEKIKDYKYSNHNIFLIESIYYAHKHGALTSEVPIFFKERLIGKSKTPYLKEGLKALILPFRLKFKSLLKLSPLKKFILFFISKLKKF